MEVFSSKLFVKVSHGLQWRMLSQNSFMSRLTSDSGAGDAVMARTTATEPTPEAKTMGMV